MKNHIKPEKRKLHQRKKLISSLAHLTKPFKINNKNIKQNPQTQLHHTLLKNFTIKTPPRVILNQLKKKPPKP